MAREVVVSDLLPVLGIVRHAKSLQETDAAPLADKPPVAPGHAGYFLFLHSSKNSTPRRRCGITIDPPTISAISNVSQISRSLAPACTH